MNRREFEAQKALGIIRKYIVVFEVTTKDGLSRMRTKEIWAVDNAEAVLKVWRIKHRSVWTLFCVRLAD